MREGIPERPMMGNRRCMAPLSLAARVRGRITVPAVGCCMRYNRIKDKWREIVLYDFCVQGNGCPDGSFPARSLAVGASGTLYGTTFNGGAKNKGIVYAVSGSALTVLHSFCAMKHCADGDGGEGLIRDAQETLYGVADSNSGGVAFQITPAGKYRAIYSFCQLADCADGNAPS